MRKGEIVKREFSLAECRVVCSFTLGETRADSFSAKDTGSGSTSSSDELVALRGAG